MTPANPTFIRINSCKTILRFPEKSAKAPQTGWNTSAINGSTDIINPRERSSILQKDVELEDCLEKSAEMAGIVVENIATGAYGAKEKKEDECKYCSFDKLCRLRERVIEEDEEEIEEEDE